MTMATSHLNKGDFLNIRLGLCQISTTSWDVEGNFKNTIDAFEQAASQNADIAITPECVLNG